MTTDQKKRLARILAALLLFIAALIVSYTVEMPYLAGVAIMAVPYLIAGYDVLFEAGRKLFTGQMFDESLLMAIASLGAFGLCFIDRSAHTAHEAAAIMIFYQVGELFQSIAVGRSRKNVRDLLSMMPDEAHVERGDGIQTVDPSEIEVGEVVVILPGERIPLDGKVIDGQSALDTASLTGESLPSEVDIGDEVLSGCINLSGRLRVRATKPSGESTASRIMELVENAGASKSKSERFVSAFARVYTPLVTFAALLAAIVPSVVVGISSGAWGFAETWKPFVHAALMFLIVSCPCALVISVPLSFFASIGAAGKKGVLVKGSTHVEALSKVRTVLFDKTGTLTRGRFSVTGVFPQPGFEDLLLPYAAALEQSSTHPLARAIVEYFDGELPSLDAYTELPGRGAHGAVCGREVYAGSRRLMVERGFEVDERSVGSAVHLIIDGKYAGEIDAGDAPKSDSADAVRALQAQGVACVMLTGDRRENADRTAKELGLDAYEAELLPEDKVALAEKYMKEKAPGTTVAFVGDGINDAPVLAGVDVGISMGALGSDAAIEASDVVLAGDRPSDLPFAMRLAKKTMRLVKENIVFAIAVKLSVLLLLLLMTFVPALSGMNDYAGEFAVFADVGVSVIAILNAMRAGKQD